MFHAWNQLNLYVKVDLFFLRKKKFRNRLLFLAKPLARLVLEKNLAESKRSNMDKEIINRSRRQVKPQSTPIKTSVIITTRKIVNQLAITTKKPSSWNAEHITSLATTGMQTIGQLANAFGSIFGKKIQFNNFQIVELLI